MGRDCEHLTRVALGGVPEVLNPLLADLDALHTLVQRAIEYLHHATDHANSDGTNSLHSIVGCARSDASKPMATLGGIDGVVQVSAFNF